MFGTYCCVLLCLFATIILADDKCPGLPDCFCSKDKTSVNCEGKGLTSVPTNIPPTTEKIYLSHNKITTITTRAFGDLPNLERIWLKHNTITEIQPFAFGNLSSLEYLDLRNNKLTEIGENAFSNASHLDTLYLITNTIQKIHEDAFIGTNSITYISLQANKLTTIPPLGNMPLLKRLIIEGNQITNATFPDCYKTNKHLEYIGLSNNVIVTLTNNTFDSLQNNSISSLYLSRNNIKSIEARAFSPLGSIKSLKLGTNPLDAEALKTAIVGLKHKDMVSFDLSGILLQGELLVDTFKLLQNTSITTLNMRNNKIQRLPNGVFSGLNKLLHLDLSSCYIQETEEDSFKGLDKLTILILNNNRLLDVPKHLPSSLVNLYLDYNQITTIDDNAFINLAYLQELRIRSNNILTLKQNSFLGMVKLNKLYLYHNNIATLPGQVFAPLVRLVSLDLGHNNLAQIQYSKDRFSSLGSLLYFNLAYNQLNYFQTDIFKNMLSLRYLHLEGNLIGDLIAQDFGGGLFQGLSNLQGLFLMDNKIRTIPAPVFQDLTSLKSLNLTNNKLSGWDADLFKSTQKLQVLDLTNNLISTIQSGNVEAFSSMQSLNLTGNPFNCNCDLRWFRDWMNTTKIVLANSTSYICHEPEEWKGKPVVSFNRNKIRCFFFQWYHILMISAAAVLIVVIIFSIMYRKRWAIRLRLYKLTRKNIKILRADDGHGNYGAIEEHGQWYDAYISCADEDQDWVLNNLLPVTDRGQVDDENQFHGRFSLYYEDRDGLVGMLCCHLHFISTIWNYSREHIYHEHVHVYRNES